MPTKRFDSNTIRSLRPADKSIEYFASNFSSGHSGRLGLRVSPQGKKTWFITYRLVSGGTMQKVNIGTHPEQSYTDAAKIASDKLADVSKGFDPRRRRTNIDDPTFNDLAELYLERHAAGKKDGGLDDRAKIDNHRLDSLRPMLLADINRRHVVDVLDRIRKQAPIGANRYWSLLSKMFNFAIERDLVPATWTNPASGISKAQEHARERYYTDQELRSLFAALPLLRSPLGTIIELIAYTGQRVSEIGGLRWDEIDFEEGVITLPRERKKNAEQHEVPMSTQVSTLLSSIVRQRGSQYVFPAPTKEGHVVFRSKAMHRVSALSGIDGYRNHDVRATVATGMDQLGVPESTIGRVLGHAEHGVTRRYIRHSGLKAKRDALQTWANHLDRVLGRGVAAKVVPIRRTA